VSAAFHTRSGTAPLDEALARDFTVYNYDRRGRGDSDDTPPHGVEREIEDMDALIAAAGGSSAVFGHSSAATLALRAAAHGLAITRLVLYEPPFVVDDSRAPLAADFPSGSPRSSPPVGEATPSSSTRPTLWESPGRSWQGCATRRSVRHSTRSPTRSCTRRRSSETSRSRPG
jgi:alpha-beta hydrolase superfamily lysophospholipase